MTRVPRLALALLLAVFAAACTSEPDDVEVPMRSGTAASVLIDRWFVDAPSAAPGTMLVLGGRAAIFLECGVLSGEWRAADGGLFVADVRGGSPACWRTEGARDLPWLRRAAAFRSEGEEVVLLAPDGTTTARLRPGAEPTAGPDHSEQYAAQPAPSAEQLRRMREPAALPAEAVAPTPAQLQRRWTPLRVSPRAEAAFLSFADGGTWQGSDGCNSTGGRYVLGTAGRLIATSGPQTLKGCDNWEGSSWLLNAARVGLVGGQLVIYDRASKEIGRVRPA